MIQRQQSLWLLLAAACGLLTFRMPFFAGANESATSGGAAYVDAGSTFFLIILTAASILLSLVTIFMYKNRKLQIKLAVTGLIISLLIIVLYFLEIQKLPGAIALWSIFSFATPIAYFMALKGIWKDEKLVKSLDKLR